MPNFEHRSTLMTVQTSNVRDRDFVSVWIKRSWAENKTLAENWSYEFVEKVSSVASVEPLKSSVYARLVFLVADGKIKSPQASTQCRNAWDRNDKFLQVGRSKSVVAKHFKLLFCMIGSQWSSSRNACSTEPYLDTPPRKRPAVFWTDCKRLAVPLYERVAVVQPPRDKYRETTRMLSQMKIAAFTDVGDIQL